MEVQALALETTRGSKQASAAPAKEEMAVGKKAAEAKVSSAGKNEAEAAVEVEQAKSSAGAAKKKKKMLVKVSDDHISLLLANPPNLTLSHRLRSLTEETCPFGFSDPQLRRSILDDLPGVADLIDEWNGTTLDILRQFHETGCAYEEIEDDEDDN